MKLLVLRMVGFSFAKESNTRLERNYVSKRVRELQSDRSALVRKWVRADARERNIIWHKEIIPYMKSIPKDFKRDYGINMHDLRTAARRAKRRVKHSISGMVIKSDRVANKLSKEMGGSF